MAFNNKPDNLSYLSMDAKWINSVQFFMGFFEAL
jgi:hypothetical protein